MKLVLNGYEGRTIFGKKGADIVMKGKLLDDDGQLFELSTGTVTLEIYTRLGRTVTASLSAAVVVTTAVNGTFVCTIANTVTALIAGRYYAFAKHALAGVNTWSDKPTLIQIG